MLSFKKFLFRCFFIGELGVFTFFYITGTHGIQSLLMLKKDMACEFEEVASLKSEIAQLEADVAAWKTNDYFKEKIAREQLQFAKSNEEIYFIS